MPPIAPRSYTVDDLPRLLAFVGRCYAAEPQANFHPGDIAHHLSNTMRGTDPAPYFHLIDGADGEPLALVEVSKYGEFEAIIHPDHRGGEFEREVLRWAVDTQVALLATLGVSEEHIAADCLDTDPIRGVLLAELGFTAAPTPHMARTIRDLSLPWPTPVLPEGFTIRPASGIEEAEAIGDVHASAFKSKWPSDLYRKVMQTPGFQIDHEMLVVAPDGALAAFLIYWLDPVSKSGLFEPVGTGEAYQRRGLIKALMQHTFGLMRDAGMTHAVVIHETDNPASSRAYESVGFVRQGVYTQYTRAL